MLGKPPVPPLERTHEIRTEKWVANAVGKFGLENTMRNRGCPKNGS